MVSIIFPTIYALLWQNLSRDNKTSFSDKNFEKEQN